MNKPSIKKIADIANVSTTTVSYVINNKPGISQETRDRVLKIIDEENYTPVTSKQHIVPFRSKNIYLVIDDFASFGNLFYSTILDICSSVAAKAGYDLILSKVDESFRNSSAAKAIRYGTAAGTIFLHDIDAETLVFLRQENVPFVVIDAHRQHPGYSRVCVDYEVAAYTVTNFLIQAGHEKLGFIGERAIPDFYTSTFNGFCRALSENHLVVHPSWLQAEACDIDSAFQCMNNILDFSEHPTGIVCATDSFALAGMHCVQEHGYSVPEDFSFIGIDDLDLSRIYFPPLTTIHIDLFEMAEKAIKFLDEQITSGSAPKEGVYVLKSDKLIVRKSVSAPKQ